MPSVLDDLKRSLYRRWLSASFERCRRTLIEASRTRARSVTLPVFDSGGLSGQTTTMERWRRLVTGRLVELQPVRRRMPNAFVGAEPTRSKHGD
jgi:hypothetical protein